MHNGVLIVDALSVGRGLRLTSRDSIGCGPRTIAGVFESNDIYCRIARAEDLLRHPSRMRSFDILAISAMSMDLPTVVRIVRYWRKTHSGGGVLVGGPITADTDMVLRVIRPDVAVIGEGEQTLQELIRCGFPENLSDIGSIRGIAFRSSEGNVVNPPRPLLSEDMLRQFHPSTVRIVDYSTYQACKVYIETVRGCSNYRRTSIRLSDGRQCSQCGNCDASDHRTRLDCPEKIPPGCGFCGVPATWGPPRSREISEIVREAKELIAQGVCRLVLQAPDFLDFMRGRYPLTDPCGPPANIKAISTLLQSLASIPEVHEGRCHISIENIKACLFNEEVAQTISNTLQEVSPNIGLETGSVSHMRQIGKCGTPEDVLRAVRIAKRYGMHPFVYLIYGLPGESTESVKASIQVMQELDAAGVERIILYGFQPLPGSAFAGFPPSNINSPGSRALRNAAERINKMKKSLYVGTEVVGIAAEPSWARHGHTMVYPLRGGPIMTVPGGFSAGVLLRVRVVQVLSAGLVQGVVIKRLDDLTPSKTDSEMTQDTLRADNTQSEGSL